MLRITTLETRFSRRLVLEGKLVSPWVAELSKEWEKIRANHNGLRMILDLKDTTAIDQEGLDVLREMMEQGATFVCTGILNRYLLKQLMRECKERIQASRESLGMQDVRVGS